MLEPSSKFVELSTGLRYHYLEWDQNKSQHTVIFLHGFLDFCGGWRAVIRPALQEKFHILVPDMRGHGDSDRVGAGGYYHFADYVADLQSFVDALARPSLSIVGHSMGGSIASYWAGAFPDRLHKLALIEGLGPPEGDMPAPERLQQWISSWSRALQRKPHIYPSVADAAEKLRIRDPRISPQVALQIAQGGTREIEGGVAFKHDPLHLSRGPIGYSVQVAQQFWQQIRCPVLLIEGADSVIRHGVAEQARRSAFLPNSRQVEIEGAGHLIARHQPEALAEVLLKFLA